jgi:hypothetical protein
MQALSVVEDFKIQAASLLAAHRQKLLAYASGLRRSDCG